MATGRTTDTRQIVRAIRLPGAPRIVETVDPVDNKKKRKKVFDKGELITDPDQLQALAEQGAVDLPALYSAGLISGNWPEVNPS
jgi:hypothetical protein